MSIVRNITIRNITETGFYLATFWITLLGCAKQIQISIEDKKRKQSGFFYQPNQNTLSSGESVVTVCIHSFFFQLNSLFHNIRKSHYQKQHKRNRILKEILMDFTFITFEIMLNISNLQRLENHINLIQRVVKVFWGGCFLFFAGVGGGSRCADFG